MNTLWHFVNWPAAMVLAASLAANLQAAPVGRLPDRAEAPASPTSSPTM
jgi:hypothetical protein